MRESAERVAAAYEDVRAGGTHQARLERDIAVETTHRRLAALDIGDTPLCFGRIDWQDGDRVLRRPPRGRRRGAHAARHRLARPGRRAVLPGDRARSDGRAAPPPPAHPARARGRRPRRRGVRPRRGRGRRAHRARRGRAARRARAQPHRPHGRHRRHDPGRAGRRGARRPARRRSSSPAGPGTGKTAVALHRAAYLLYTYRRRLGSQGVLLVGPSPVFLRYIEQVLPSLGEHEVQLATVARAEAAARRRPTSTRRPSQRSRATPAWRPCCAARSPTGSGRRASDVELTIDGLRLRLSRRECRRVLERVQRRPRHAQRAPTARRSACCSTGSSRSTATRWRARTARCSTSTRSRTRRATSTRATTRRSRPRSRAARRRRGSGSASSPAGCAATPRSAIALERMWPVLTGAELVHDLFSFEALIRSAADGVLDARGAARPVPAPVGVRARRAVDRGRRRARRRGRRAARPGRGGAARAAGAGGRRRSGGGRGRGRAWCGSSASAGTRPPPALAERYGGGAEPGRRRRSPSCGPSATSSSTRRRTSRRCSGGCWPAAARPGR